MVENGFKALHLDSRHPDEIDVDNELALLVTADGDRDSHGDLLRRAIGQDLKILVDDVEMVCIEGRT